MQHAALFLPLSEPYFAKVVARAAEDGASFRVEVENDHLVVRDASKVGLDVGIVPVAWRGVQ